MLKSLASGSAYLGHIICTWSQYEGCVGAPLLRSVVIVARSCEAISESVSASKA